MKRLFIILLVGLYVGPALSAMVCAKNADSDTERVNLVMDPSINGSGYGNDAGNMVWYTKFAWGTISGTAGCFDVNGGSQGTTNATIGEDTPGGKYCWCLMEHPAVSLCTFNYAYSSASDCASDCASACGGYARINSALRGGLFGSVAK